MVIHMIKPVQQGFHCVAKRIHFTLLQLRSEFGSGLNPALILITEGLSLDMLCMIQLKVSTLS